MKRPPKDWSEEYFKVYSCPVCGKKFCKSSSLWAYRLPNDGPAVCSYSCTRKGQAKYEMKLKRKK